MTSKQLPPFSDSSIHAAQIGAGRVEFGNPVAYRLGRRNGELVLQGNYAYFCAQGYDKYGNEWRDIPIVDLDTPEIN